MTARSALLAMTICLPGALACSSHQKSDSTWTNDDKEEARPLNDSETLGEAAPLTDTSGGADRAPVGVRHDVALAPGKREARCSCLAVEVGGAGERKFQWANGPPPVGSNAMVIAVSAHGVACPGGEPDEAKRRGSISAVDREGADVLIEIEEVPEGRPIASGAIIPRPGAGGGVYVRPKNAKLPYARAQAGGRCKVF
jgi:hypothetical protein